MDTQYVDKDSTWYCPRCIAEKSLYAFGNKTLWQELINECTEHDLTHDALVKRTQELDRTKKALDIAINVLNRVKDVKYEEYIDEKLEQINKLTKGNK